MCGILARDFLTSSDLATNGFCSPRARLPSVNQRQLKMWSWWLVLKPAAPRNDTSHFVVKESGAIVKESGIADLGDFN